MCWCVQWRWRAENTEHVFRILKPCFSRLACRVVQNTSFCGATHILITASQNLSTAVLMFVPHCICAAASLDVTERVFQRGFLTMMLDSLNKTQIGLSLPDEKESVAHYVSASRQQAYVTTLKFKLFIPDSPIWLVVCFILNLRPSLVSLCVTPASEEGLL